MDLNHHALLIELGAHEKSHSGRTLFDHLKGVHDLLRDWGNDKHVCDAGLFHSIYGNSIFKHQSTNDRALIAYHIGDRAELLVHYFCTQDRPKFLGVYETAFRNELIEIEAANLYEQNPMSETLRIIPRKTLSNGARMALQGLHG